MPGNAHLAAFATAGVTIALVPRSGLCGGRRAPRELERRGHVVVPIVLIALGAAIIAQAGTISAIIP